MEAYKIEIVLLDDSDGEYFITQVLPKLKKEHNMKQIFYHKCDWIEG